MQNTRGGDFKTSGQGKVISGFLWNRSLAFNDGSGHIRLAILTDYGRVEGQKIVKEPDLERDI